MPNDRLKGSPEKKEVSRKVTRRESPSVGNKSIRNALLLAGGLTVGGFLPQACNPESESGERTGRVSQALASGWNAPTTPSLGFSGATGLTYVDRSGSNISVYVVNNSGGNFDVKTVGTNNGGATWTSPSPTAVPGANSGQKESDFKICGSNAYIVSGKDGLSDKLYVGSWGGGTVGALSAVPGTLNDDFATVLNVACNSGATKIYATSDLLSSNPQVFTADIGTWTWSQLSACSDSTKNTFGIFVDTNDFYVASDRTGTVGSTDLMVYNGGWNGTNCSGAVTNLNAVAGSAVVNDANAQDTPFIDSAGDLWYTDNGAIKWATKKGGSGDGGAGGDGGDAGTGGDGGMGGDGGKGGDGGGPTNCFAKISGNVTIDNCSDTQLNTHVQGTGTVQVGTKTFNFTEGQGTFGFSQPNLANFSTGLAHEDSEDPSDPNKDIETGNGDWLGFEGTKTATTYPDALNPNKSKGIFDVVGYQTIEGAQRIYSQDCKPVNDSIKGCSTANIDGAKDGFVLAGTTVFKNLNTGVISTDENKVKPVDPVKDPPGGCSCSDVQNQTLNGVDIVMLAAGLGIVIARRNRKNKTA